MYKSLSKKSDNSDIEHLFKSPDKIGKILISFFGLYNNY